MPISGDELSAILKQRVPAEDVVCHLHKHLEDIQ